MPLIDPNGPPILVTGAAGFVGANVCQALIARGCRVVGVDVINDYYEVELKHYRLTQLKAEDAFDFRKIDLADAAAVDALFEEFNFSLVIHLAAQAGVRYSIENPNAYIQSNLLGFQHVLENCRRHKP